MVIDRSGFDMDPQKTHLKNFIRLFSETQSDPS